MDSKRLPNVYIRCIGQLKLVGMDICRRLTVNSSGKSVVLKGCTVQTIPPLSDALSSSHPHEFFEIFSVEKSKIDTLISIITF